MPSPSHAARLLATALAMALLAGSTPTQASPKPSSLKQVHIENGLSPLELRTLYHGPEGSEFISLAVLGALHNSEGQPFLSSPQLYGLLEDPDDPDHLPVGISKYRFPGVAIDAVGFNCAACHVNEFTYKDTAVRVEGAPSLFNLSAFYVELFRSIDKTVKDPVELGNFLIRFAEQRSPRKQGESDASLLRRIYDEEALPKNDAEVQAYVQSEAEHHAQAARQGEMQLAESASLLLESEDDVDTFKETIAFLESHYTYLVGLMALDSPTAAGPGRLDAFDGARALLFGPQNAIPLSAPVSYPFLWGFPEQDWLHYDANTNSILQRNMGQAMGMGATFNPTSYSSTLLPRHIDTLNKVAGRVKAPRWPEDVLGRIDVARSEAGRKVFNEHCERCHGPSAGKEALYSLQEIGTDGNRIKNFDAPVDTPVGKVPFSQALADLLTKLENQAFEDARIPPDERKSMEPASPVWRSTGKYAARPLNGIWATAPYLHNGSVPTLWALLQPARQRPTCFPVGQREYDPDTLGYANTSDSPGKCSTAQDACATPRSEGSTQWFNVQCTGNSNAGHEYGTHLPEKKKRQLLEYLKTL